MKHILVPTDFSACANDALKVAAGIARKADARLHLIHLYYTPYSGLSLQYEVDKKEVGRIKDIVSAEMDALVNQDFLENIEVSKHIVADIDIRNIFEAYSLPDIDLIVMGSHGAGGFKEAFIGSNTQKVVQMSEAPVLVVKKYFDAENIKDIVFASNFYIENESGFEPIKKLANLLEARMHLLKVITPTNFESTTYSHQIMEDFAKKMCVENYTLNIFNETSPERGIMEFSEMMNADLVAMETHGRKGFKHFILGSVVEGVVNHSKIPVITSHIEKPVF